MSLIRVDLKKCKREGVCVEVCPLGILTLSDEDGPRVVRGRARHCIACGHCVAACPHGALDNVRNPLASQALLPRFPVVDAPTAMAFLRSRRSIRRYRQDPVPREQIAQVLDAARYAPSGHNSQGISYMVVDDRPALRHITTLVVEWMRGLVASQPDMASRLHMPGIIKAHENGEDRILRNAPALIVAFAPRDLVPAPVTTTLALEYLELYATTLRLGTCWAGYTQVCAQRFQPLVEFLRVPSDMVVTGMMMLGYPKFGYHRLPERNPLSVRWFEAKAL